MQLRKTPRTQKVGDSHVPSQDGNELVSICPESLMLQANSKHWEVDGQGGGGREKQTNKKLTCPQKREMNTRTRYRIRHRRKTRPNPRKCLSHGQNQPGQHGPARAISWCPSCPQGLQNQSTWSAPSRHTSPPASPGQPAPLCCHSGTCYQGL